MGLFGGLFGDGGASDAYDQAADYGNQALDTQTGWLDYLKGMYEPYGQAGQDALGMQMGLLDKIGGLMSGPDYEAAANSPAFQELEKQGSNAIMNQAAVTGGVRGGNTQGLLAENSQDVLNKVAMQDYQNQMGSTMNYFNALGSLSNMGLQSNQGLGQFGGDTVGGIVNTLGGLGSLGLNEAAGKQQKQSGMWNTIGKVAGAAAMFFSDIELKDNIKFTGEYSKKGYPLYSWIWNEDAEKLGLHGNDEGVLADEVEQYDPSAIIYHESGYKKVDYARI